MDIYEMAKIDYEEYEYIIFSQSYQSPFSCLDVIQSKLQELGLTSCKVIFDMLLTVGNTSDRFVEAHFNGKELNNFSYINIRKDSNLRKIASNYYSQKQEPLTYSILTSSQIKMLGKGLAI